MVEKMSKIVNPTGMHARSASQFVNFINKYNCCITLISENRVANAKSILNILMLNLDQGSEFTVRVEGNDEEIVLTEVLKFIENMEH